MMGIKYFSEFLIGLQQTVSSELMTKYIQILFILGAT